MQSSTRAGAPWKPWRFMRGDASLRLLAMPLATISRARARQHPVMELGLGLYTSAQTVEQKLRKAGHDVEAARAEGLLFARMTGYAVFPWADASGQPMTLYGRWPAKDAAGGQAEDAGASREGTKASPLYFDRARQAGLKDLVLVEGLIDAALLQARGEAGVIACMGAQFSASQLETLARYGVRSVTICLDPDGAGETGTLACIKGFMERE